MHKSKSKFLYRIFCVIALFVAVYLIVDLKISGTLELRMLALFILFFIVIIWGIADWKYNYEEMKRKEAELKMYKMYIKPLEQLVTEIRANQHEFDNHLNAILNMHVTIDDYDELVKSQAAYAKDCITSDMTQFIPLLKISDKVLAGFLYSKIIAAPDYIETQMRIQTLEILSGISEHDLIEIIGTLVDNAYEACTDTHHHVIIILDSKDDKILFCIKNEISEIRLEEVSRFFEPGYSTKQKDGARGLGLYHAKMIAGRHHGKITVERENIGQKQYLSFQLEI